MVCRQGCLRALMGVLLHDELADGVDLLAGDADEVGTLGIAREVNREGVVVGDVLTFSVAWPSKPVRVTVVVAGFG